MIVWIKRLFHLHEWEIILKGHRRGIGESGKIANIGYWYDCRCKICGKIKSFET